jgi:cyclomaltodextrinase
MSINPHDRYRHYKGKNYKILCLGTNTETLEKEVVYQGLYDDPQFGKNPIWVRPLSMFCETIIIDGKEVPRFTKIIE